MDTLLAFAMGDANRENRMRVFDWNKAATLIKERKPKYADAGLGGDWEWTGGEIFSNGKVVTNSYTYLASCWAIPEIDIDGDVIPCWSWMDETEWDEHTKWPDSARKILEGKEY